MLAANHMICCNMVHMLCRGKTVKAGGHQKVRWMYCLVLHTNQSSSVDGVIVGSRLYNERKSAWIVKSFDRAHSKRRLLPDNSRGESRYALVQLDRIRMEGPCAV